jgi:MFS transporter, NNP family, nitrate/nitrite transporter
MTRNLVKSFKPGAARALFLSTTAFAVSFAVWGLIGALAPTFARAYGLSAKAKSLMIAIPVLLGAVGRIPAGMLADRFGSRRVFAVLLLLSAIPAVLISVSNSYMQLIGLGLFLGIAGSTFPVGVGFTSKWFTPDQQGTALGVYGMGNIGQSIAVFGAPVLAIALGSWRPVFFAFAAMSAVWAVVFYLFARDARSEAKPKTVAENFAVLRREPVS